MMPESCWQTGDSGHAAVRHPETMKMRHSGKPGTGTAAGWSVGVTGLGASSGGASPRFAAVPLLCIFEAGTAAPLASGDSELGTSSGGASPRFAVAPLKPFLGEDGVLARS